MQAINILDPNLGATHPTLVPWVQAVKNAGYTNEQIQMYYGQKMEEMQSNQMQHQQQPIRLPNVRIEVGCTRATQGACNLTLKTGSTDPSSKVKCANEANNKDCSNLWQYYYCAIHEIIMCCNCTEREQIKEKEERLKTDIYDADANNEYTPTHGEILGARVSKDNGRKSDSKQNKIDKQSRKRKAPSESSKHKRQPPHKKMKTNKMSNQNQSKDMNVNMNISLESIADLSLNDIVKMISGQQNEIKQQKQRIQKLKKKEKKQMRNVKEKEQTVTNLNAKIAYMNNIFQKKQQQLEELKLAHEKTINQFQENQKVMTTYIAQENKKSIAVVQNCYTLNQINTELNKNLTDKGRELQKYKKTVDELKENKNIMTDKFNALSRNCKEMKIEIVELKQECEKVIQNNETVREQLEGKKTQLMIEQADLKKSEIKNKEYEKQRMELRHARDTCPYQQFHNTLNNFLDKTINDFN